MGNILCVIGGLLAILGRILLYFLIKPESVKKNVYGVLDNYQDEEILSDEDWEKCTEYIKRPLDTVIICSKMIMLGFIIIMLGVLVNFVGIWV